MPQIANQDYNVIDFGNWSPGNMGAGRQMAQLLNAIKRGTIFDVIIRYGVSYNGGFVPGFSKVVAVTDYDGQYLVYYANTSFSIQYSEIQYFALADMAQGGMDTGDLLVSEEGYLTCSDEIFAACDGKYIRVTLDDNDNIASYVVTDVEAVGVDTANIPEEDLPGLIGLFAGN